MSRRIAVLGAGIMGTCLAIELARRGWNVTVFDAAGAPLQGASRWNEGKIHLGYLYAADPSLATARRLVADGLSFAPIIEDLIGGTIEAVTEADDIYLVHRRSAVDQHSVGRYFDAVSGLVSDASSQGRYFRETRRAVARRLTASELESMADPAIIDAGFTVPERSVDTVRLADRLTAVLRSEPGIELRMSERIDAVARDASSDGWRVAGEPFDWVINALWHGRIAVDVTAGLPPEAGWSHRYRVSAFVRTSRPVDVASSVIALGPFGDVKNYNGRDFYASWYPAGLLHESASVAPPDDPMLDAAQVAEIVGRIERELTALLPPVAEIFRHAEKVTIAGGHVFAMGSGSLADAAASIHRRDRFGVRTNGHYISVDTGKYSTAPAMARALAIKLTA
jgi:glycine/D-amino acid oxidase-like deaminating enzyme